MTITVTRKNNTGFDDYFKSRHEKTGIYVDAMCGMGNALYLKHEMRKSYIAGQKSRQPEIDALESSRVKVMAVVSELNALIHTAEDLHSKETSTAVCKLLDDLAIVLHGDG